MVVETGPGTENDTPPFLRDRSPVRFLQTEKAAKQQRLIANTRRDTPDTINPWYKELRCQLVPTEYVEKDHIRERPASRSVLSWAGSSQNGGSALGILGKDNPEDSVVSRRSRWPEMRGCFGLRYVEDEGGKLLRPRNSSSRLRPRSIIV